MTDIRLINVSRRFQPTSEALDRLTITVNAGECLAIVGPSGSGKTTILRLIAGLDSPTDGQILIGGQSMTRIPPHRRHTAMTFQHASLYPHLTCIQNLLFPLRIRRVSSPVVKQRIRAISKLLEIEHLLDRLPQTLSGGEQQRVAIARALIQQPQCLLLDEPMSNLDPPARATLCSVIKHVHQRTGVTLVVVTHDQSEAMSLGQRIVVLHRGQCQQVGTPRDVYLTPNNRFVAGFIGTPAMNFIDGRIEMIEGRLQFTDGSSLAIPVHESSNGRTLRDEPRSIVLGIRPEHVFVERPETPSATEIPARVGKSLWHGSLTTMMVRIPSGQQIVAASSACSESQLQSISRIWIDPELIHFFEPGEFGSNLMTPQSL